MFGLFSKWLKSKTSSDRQEFQTPHGLFKQWHAGGLWDTPISYREKEIPFVAMDVEGQPYPYFVDQIPNILRQLISFEADARKCIPQITARHELDSVNGENLDTDFSLVFYYEENEEVDSDSDAITVYFKNGQIVNWEREDFNEDLTDEELAEESPPTNTQPNQTSNPWGAASSNDGSAPSPWSS